MKTSLTTWSITDRAVGLTAWLALPLVVAPASSFAQSPTENGLEEVVVTAQRREESLRTTSLTVDVLTGEMLASKQVDNLEALQFATPGLSVAATGVTSSVNIRGIGLGVSSPAVVAGVAVYRDNLFQPPILSTEPLFDMAAVEVLRGPQGTFVGSSSTGGAIFYRSANPKIGVTEGNVGVRYGNYETVGFDGAINLSISDTFAARVAFNSEDRDSFFKQTGVPASRNPGGAFAHPGDLNQRNLRASLLWQPNDQLTVVAKTAYNKNDTDGLAHIPSLANPAYSGVDYKLQYNLLDSTYDERGIRQSLQIDYEFSNGIVLRSTSGYNVIDADYVDDFDSASIDSTFTNHVKERLASQEFNLISPTNGPLSWIVGAFYFWDPAEVRVQIDQLTAPTTIVPDTLTTKSAEAVFGQVSWKVAPSLELQLGARYTQSHAKVEGDLTLIGLAPFPIVIDQTRTQNDDGVTGKVALNWTINDDHYLYAFAAKGYKAGGINGPEPTPNFDPEFVYDYEMGLKSSWLNGMLRTDINVFSMNYQNLQLTSYIPPTQPFSSGGFTGGNAVTNAGASKIEGFELQMQGRAGGFIFDTGASYVRSKLGQTLFVNSQLLPGTGNVPLGPQCAAGVTSNPPTCFDYSPATSNFSGRRNPYSPEWTVTAGLGYDFHLAGGGKLTPRVDYSYTASQWQSIQQSPNDFMDARRLLNAQLTYEFDTWQVRTYVTNATDEVYVVGQTYGPSVFLGRPRQYGLGIRKQF